MFALRAMNVPTDSVLNYGLDDTYRYLLEKHLVVGGMQPQDLVLHLGEVFGDLLKSQIERTTSTGRLVMCRTAMPAIF